MASESNGSGQKEVMMEKVGLWLAAWSETEWFPDALVFALIGIVIVFCFGLSIGESPGKLAIEGGNTFWVLIPFTMQMAMIIIGGFVVASSPPVYRLIQMLASVPKTGRGAVAFVAVFSMVSSLISWGFSLIFSGLLVRELTRRVKGMDYRAAGAAAYLGLGAVWALGTSSSAALMMGTRSAVVGKRVNASREVCAGFAGDFDFAWRANKFRFFLAPASGRSTA